MAEYVSKATLYNLCQPTGVFRLHVSHIDQMPAADVAPVVHGRWMETPFGYYGRKSYECSCCHADPFWNKNHITVKFPCCPNCGAKMDGGKA